jgi:sugar/nucleoside kinase (ribokinase family)
MKNQKAIVAGHICIDITPIFPEEKKEALANLFVPGKLIHTKEANVHTGGAVANTGLAMKLLGSDVRLIGKIGNDAFGGMVRDILKHYHASEKLIVSNEVSTSYSIVIAPPGIDRIFLHNPGANDSFQSEDITEEVLMDTALFHFGYPTLMKSMYQNEGKELTELFRKVKSFGVATSLDLAAIDAESEAGKVDWIEILTQVLPYVDFFVPSVEELCFMLDRPLYNEWMKKANGADVTGLLDIAKDIKPLASKCLSMGVKVLLLKCGAPGMYYKTASVDVIKNSGEKLGIDYADWADREGFEKSYIPDKVLSGTGAGDTSIAAFLASMLQGYRFDECIQLASATGASCVEAYDALSGLKSFDELKDKIKRGWKKNI